MRNAGAGALGDFRRSLLAWRLWTLLGWMEIRQRYARSSLGPFWLTISMGVMIGSLGVVYGTLFGQNMSDYLPFLAIGLVMWTAFAQTVTEGSLAYISSAAYIRQASTPKLIFVLQVAWRNLVILLHNFVIVLILLGIFGLKSWQTLPLFIPGFILFMLNALWIAMLSGLLSARFRDLPQIVAALVQVAFYLTPILYMPKALSKHQWIVDYNPLAHLIELVRAPLIGAIPSSVSWMIGIGMAVTGLAISLFFTHRYLKRIAYWV
ncbi:MAG: ABC transporter permease [Burkholderiaceae bacterium]